MASHKNQHFVPRCYLRPFTLDQAGTVINLYNVDRRKGICGAPVRGQCSRSYFYGEDLRLERLLQLSESKFAEVIRNITSPNFVLRDPEKSILRHFGLLQQSRPEAAARRAALLSSDVADIAFEGNVPLELRMSVKQAVQLSLQTFAETMHAIDDLKVVLICNRTEQSFIASDDPAILTNRWYMQTPIARHMSFGIGSAGVLLFLPLTPTVLCVIYDGDVYTMPHDRGWIEVRNPRDVDLFNLHQVLNCATNIYFSDWSSATYVDRLYQEAAHLHPPIRHEIVVAALEKEEDCEKIYSVIKRQDTSGREEILLHMKHNRPQPPHWPSIIRLRERKRVYSNGTGVGFVRKSLIGDRHGYKNIY
jgi:hypothetical protein